MHLLVDLASEREIGGLKTEFEEGTLVMDLGQFVEMRDLTCGTVETPPCRIGLVSQWRTFVPSSNSVCILHTLCKIGSH